MGRFFPGFFIRPGFGFCPCPGSGFRSGLGFCFGLGLQTGLFFRLGFGGFFCFCSGLGVRFGFGFVLSFFFGCQTGPDPGQALAGAFPGAVCGFHRSGPSAYRRSLAGGIFRFRRCGTAVVDRGFGHIALFIHARRRQVDFDFSLAFIQYGPGMVDPDQAAVPVHIIGIRKGLEFGRVHIIQILEPVLGQSCQLVFGIVVAERPQFPGLPVKGHTDAFFHAHVGGHHQGEADQILVGSVDIVMDLAAPQGGGFADERSHLAAESPVDFVIRRPAAAADLRTFHRYFIFRTAQRLYGDTGLRRPDRNCGGPQDQTAHQDSTSFFQH